MRQEFKKMSRDATVHPKTVENYAEHGEQFTRRRTTRRRKAQPVTHTRVNPAAWKEALRIANGDTARIEVIAENDVMVHNTPGWRKRRP